jgi:hypothetical protein
MRKFFFLEHCLSLSGLLGFSPSFSILKNSLVHKHEWIGIILRNSCYCNTHGTNVGIATGYGLNGRGLILGRGERDFSLFHNVQTGSG